MQFKHNIYLLTFCLDDLFVVKSEALLVINIISTACYYGIVLYFSSQMLIFSLYI